VTRDEYKAKVEKILDEECKKGKHSLEEIFESGNDMESIKLIPYIVRIFL